VSTRATPVVGDVAGSNCSAPTHAEPSSAQTTGLDDGFFERHPALVAHVFARQIVDNRMECKGRLSNENALCQKS